MGSGDAERDEELGNTPRISYCKKFCGLGSEEERCTSEEGQCYMEQQPTIMEGNLRIWRWFQLLGSQLDYAGMAGVPTRLDFGPFMLGMIFGDGCRGDELVVEVERLRILEAEFLQAMNLHAKEREKERGGNAADESWRKVR